MSSDGSLPSLEGLLLAAVYTLLFECVRYKLKSIHYENAYWSERRGRTRVEQEMRKLTNVQLNTSNGFFVQPIGHIFSCYRQCVGTPRQGALVPLSRASLILTNNMSPESLDGLEEFSHVWLTFKFHLNTNTLKEAKAFVGVVGDGNSKRNYTFKAKIVPPMLKEKKGVLATRSPHRPNPVGVTLARIERVDKRTRTIHLSCCDLVDGTPIYDVKPYVPAYDNVSPFRVPTWIAETIDTRNQVIIPQTLLDSIKVNSSSAHNGSDNDDMVGFKPKKSSLESSLREYKNDINTFIQAIIQTLEGMYPLSVCKCMPF